MNNLPAILSASQSLAVLPSGHELALLSEARQLFDSGFHSYALLGVWHAAVHNLRRRIEAYGTDLWVSVVKDEAGRRKYDKDCDTIADRWSGADDLVLFTGASRLNLLDKKGAKALEIINWTRNHASPAHDSDSPVGPTDVVALAMLLQVNLFEKPMPDPGHSIAGLCGLVKTVVLDQSKVDYLSDQIRALTVPDLRSAFGFLLDMMCDRVAPAAQNAWVLLPVAWDQTPEDVRKTAGLRYHAVTLDPNVDTNVDTSVDKSMASRLLDFLTAVGGIKYVSDAARARVYRRAARLLADAKNQSYGWSAEEEAARTLTQFGPWLPNIAFDEV